nr:hypothetical protein [uncultured bacterium]
MSLEFPPSFNLIQNRSLATLNIDITLAGRLVMIPDSAVQQNSHLEQHPSKILWLIISVMIARRSHLFPSRTEQLSSSAPMIVGPQGPAKVGRRGDYAPKIPGPLRGWTVLLSSRTRWAESSAERQNPSRVLCAQSILSVIQLYFLSFPRIRQLAEGIQKITEKCLCLCLDPQSSWG